MVWCGGVSGESGKEGTGEGVRGFVGEKWKGRFAASFYLCIYLFGYNVEAHHVRAKCKIIKCQLIHPKSCISLYLGVTFQ